MSPRISKQFHIKSSLFSLLIVLTVLFMFAQLLLFIVHAKITFLTDESVTTSLNTTVLLSVVLFPILFFVLLQIAAHVFFTLWIWFISTGLAQFLQLPKTAAYFCGIFCWGWGCFTIWMLNSYYYPHSFFSQLSHAYFSAFYPAAFKLILWIACGSLSILTGIAYLEWFYFKRKFALGSLFLAIIGVSGLFFVYDALPLHPSIRSSSSPDIILIGLDSLRPDFTGYLGHFSKTPHIDQFLQTGTTFTQAYTPLARTFPAWISILTGAYPKHHGARNNLMDVLLVEHHQTLAKRLQQAGYETIYATDENRFSNITASYGFAQILGPHMGANDFLLGGLSDFPLTNLMINTPLGSFLFPYQYANRAAAITYDPDTFLHLLKRGLNKRTGRPLFLAVHLCLAHWPYTWARDGLSEEASLAKHYQNSVEAVDNELGKLMALLKANGLLENSIVVLLSDHGTSVGLPGDKLLRVKKYDGDLQQLKIIPVAKWSQAPAYSIDFAKDYSIETAYGQGTDVLSLKQYHVLLSFNRFGALPFFNKKVDQVSSLLDITPTLLDLLGLTPLSHMDGVSLRPFFYHAKAKALDRPLFMETGDYVSELEKRDFAIGKVIQKRIQLFQVNPLNGLVSMHQKASQSLIKNKQIAVMWGDWILARYPARIRAKLIPLQKEKTRLTLLASLAPAYFLLANVKTLEWTMDFSLPLAKKAPLEELKRKLKDFYQDEG